MTINSSSESPNRCSRHRPPSNSWGNATKSNMARTLGMSTLRPSNLARASSWGPRWAPARRKTWPSITLIYSDPRIKAVLTPICKWVTMATQPSVTRKSGRGSRRRGQFPTLQVVSFATWIARRICWQSSKTRCNKGIRTITEWWPIQSPKATIQMNRWCLTLLWAREADLRSVNQEVTCKIMKINSIWILRKRTSPLITSQPCESWLPYHRQRVWAKTYKNCLTA